MEALGNLGRRLVAYVVLLAVVVLAFKLVVGVLAGFAQAIVGLVTLLVIVVALVWAVRHI
jgi:hypothetical protein